MALEWIYSSEHVDWEELSALYLVAPLGQKDPSDLKIAFANSMFKGFIYDSGRLVAAGRALANGKDCSFIVDVPALPGNQGRGLGRNLESNRVELSRIIRRSFSMQP